MPDRAGWRFSNPWAHGESKRIASVEQRSRLTDRATLDPAYRGTGHAHGRGPWSGRGLLPVRASVNKLLPRSSSVVDIQCHGTHELPTERRLSIQLPLKSRRVSVFGRFQGLDLVSEVLR